jgi:hypothetical protein
MCGPDKLAILTSLLDEGPRTIVRDMEEVSRTDYETVCRTLTGIYNTTRNATLRTDMLNRATIKEDETIQLFTKRLQFLSRKAFPDEEIVTERQRNAMIIDGLLRQAYNYEQMHAKILKYQSLPITELADKLAGYEEDHNKAEIYRTRYGKKPTTEKRNKEAEGWNHEKDDNETKDDDKDIEGQAQANAKEEENIRDMDWQDTLTVTIDGYFTEAHVDPIAIMSLIWEDKLEEHMRNSHKEQYQMLETTGKDNITLTCSTPGTKLEVKGLVLLPIKYKQIEKELPVYVVKGNGPAHMILGQTFIMTHETTATKRDGNRMEVKTQQVKEKE